jgi:hypothetical protein
MGNKGGSRRKISSLFWPSILKKKVTIPAIEEDVPGSGKAAGRTPKVNGHPLAWMKRPGKAEEKGFIFFIHPFSLYKK